MALCFARWALALVAILAGLFVALKGVSAWMDAPYGLEIPARYLPGNERDSAICYDTGGGAGYGWWEGDYFECDVLSDGRQRIVAYGYAEVITSLSYSASDLRYGDLLEVLGAPEVHHLLRGRMWLLRWPQGAAYVYGWLAPSTPVRNLFLWRAES